MPKASTTRIVLCGGLTFTIPILRDLAATVDLPPHSALFSQQLLDLTHRWWSEAEGPHIDEGDVYPLAAAACICIKLHSARYHDPAPLQLPDPQQPARSLTNPLTTLDAILGRRQPHNVPPLRSAQAVTEVELESMNYELATSMPADWACLFEVRFSLRVQHLRQRCPQVTGSLLALLLRTLWCSGERGPVRSQRLRPGPPGLLGVHAKSHRELCLVPLAPCFLQTGDRWGKAALVRSASLDTRPLALSAHLSLAPHQNVQISV